MITFKQFLFESQNYPLYHGTPLKNLALIITSNKLDTGGFSDADYRSGLRDKPTVSFTRSLKFAQYWAKRSSWYAGESDGEDMPVIKINREKLRTRYKIVPYNHFIDSGARKNDNQRFLYDMKHGTYRDLDRNQYEERVVGSVQNVDRYIESIIMKPATLKLFKQRYPNEYETAKQKGWL